METTRGVHDTAPDALPALVTSWRRSLAARRASPATIDTYSTADGQLADYLASHGMPHLATTIRGEHVEALVTDLLEHKAPATAHNGYRGCQAFFNWLIEEGEIKSSPMERMKPPKLPKGPPPVRRDTELRRLLDVCRPAATRSAPSTALSRAAPRNLLRI